MNASDTPSIEWNGTVDIRTIASRSSELAPYLGSARGVRVNVAALDGLDTAGWQLLLAAASETTRHGGALQLDGVPQWMRDDAVALGLASHLEALSPTLARADP